MNEEELKIVMSHIKELGMKEIPEYKSWCSEHGFLTKIKKSNPQRAEELRYHYENKYVVSLKESRDIAKSDDQLLPATFRKVLEIPDDFIEFFKFMKKKTKFLESNNSDSYYYKEALTNIWFCKDRWIKDYKDWKPKSKNVDKQLTQLLRHLFTVYKDVPAFMDEAWKHNLCEHRYSQGRYGFRDDPKLFSEFTFKPDRYNYSKYYIQWFFDLCDGKNIRKSEGIPYPLTKRMSHCFTKAPSYYTIDEAFHYARVIGMGGSIRLVEQVKHKIGFREFWVPLIRMYIENPMLDVHTFGQLVDYVQSQIRGNPPLQPRFSFKHRTAEALFRQSEEWHQREDKDETKKKEPFTWEGMGFDTFKKREGKPTERNYKVWSIEEITKSTTLSKEGRVMHHCVSSYAESCRAGRCSIFSLKLKDYINGKENKVTIEVIRSTRLIVQTKCKYNKKPSEKEFKIISEWASLNNLKIKRSIW